MNEMQHPLAQLSAYLDDALKPNERGTVEAHLSTCASCRTRLAELRATSTLIRALPDLRPSRRLAPRLASRPSWLAPLRTLSTFASGVSVFLFLATALLSNMNQFAATSAPAMPAAGGAGAAPAASSAPAFSAADNAARSVGSGVPAPSPAAAPATTSGAGAEKQATTAASPSTRQELSASSPSLQDRGAPAAEPRTVSEPSRSILSMPLLWLALAAITGLLAIALQRRLRSA